jgi:hypothetical protein
MPFVLPLPALRRFALPCRPMTALPASDAPVPRAAPGTAPAAASAAACLNCGQVLGPPPMRFCPACGQETDIQPPKVVEFLQQFGGAYFSTEGALWRTLKLLLLKPGELTVLYLAGRRKHYVLPLRLYLSVSLVFLLLARFVGGVEVVRGLDKPEVLQAERGPLPTLVLSAPPLRLGIREGVFVCDFIPAQVCQLLRSRAAPDTRTLLHKVRLANERVVANFGAVMFVLLPLFAACLMLANLGSGLRYTAHLVFALHLHAFWFIALAVMRLSPEPLVWLGAAVMVVYTLLAGGRVYGGRWLPRLARAVVMSLSYMTLLALTLAAAWLLALMA